MRKWGFVIALAAIAVGSRADALQVCEGAPQILNCYHPTATFVGCDVVQRLWPIPMDQEGRGTIYFKGVTGRAYKMDYALVTKDAFFQVVVLADSAIFRPNPNCTLSNWQPMGR